MPINSILWLKSLPAGNPNLITIMHCLEVIKAMNNRAATVILDNYNRDCSLCKSRGGYVAHSAATRSTHFASRAEHEETYILYYWVEGISQLAINTAVEHIEAGFSVAQAWRAVLQAIHGARIPGLVIRGGDKVKHARVPIVAEIPSGACVLHLGATGFADLHFKLSKLG